MSEQITIETYHGSLSFNGKLLAQIEGHPYPGKSVSYYEYEVYERESDSYFVCVDHVSGEIKALESPKQVIDFFGYDPISKQLFDRLGLDTAIEISTQEDGAGTNYVLECIKDRDYEFVGELIHRSLLNPFDDILEVYKLNVGGYISAVKTDGGYKNVQSLDEQALIELINF